MEQQLRSPSGMVETQENMGEAVGLNTMTNSMRSAVAAAAAARAEEVLLVSVFR